MSDSLRDVEMSPPAPDETARLSKRVDAVRQVSEMASAGSAKLLGLTRQMDGDLVQLARDFESLPDAAQVDLVQEQMGSMQAVLDWLTTSSPPDRGRDLSGFQTRLSIKRVEVAEIQAEITQAAAVARRLRETHELLSGLVEGAESLESTQEKAAALLLEARELSAELEREAETPANTNGSG